MKKPPFVLISSDCPSLHSRGVEISRLCGVASVARRLGTVGIGDSLTPLANEAEAPDRVSLTGLANEIAETGDGWALIPFGEWQHERCLQRFGKEEAEQMVGYFKNVWNSIKRAFVGMPIYRGHPDQVDELRREMKNAKTPSDRARLEAMANSAAARWTDRTVYGTIADMEVREHGLAIRPVLTEDGASLVNEQGLKFFSPHWLAIDLPAKDGKPVKAPVYMMSIGLTDKPNISGTSLVNEQPLSEAMNKLIIALLAALGRPLANEATESQIAEALTEAVPHVTSLVQRPEPTALANEQTLRTAAEGQLAELTTALANERQAIADLTTALANERAAVAAANAARNEAVLGAAIATGRITEAQKPVWLGRLERDFAVESAALANEAPKVKVAARTSALGDRKPQTEASAKFTSLVNERCEKEKESWPVAWAAVKNTPEGKALFEQMEAAPAAS